MEKIVRVRVSGRVQGVGFRAFVQFEAAARDIRGWVRNRRDGDVEAVFAGETEAVMDLCVVCRHGPPHARVDQIKIFEEDDSALAEAGETDGFIQLPTI